MLREHDDLLAIQVGDADKATVGNGHAYFRDSPWVSSDIMMTLRYGLLPAERGLVRGEDEPIRRFPPDYIATLRETLFRVNPGLAERARRQAVTANR